jgi:hypothetical protein
LRVFLWVIATSFTFTCPAVIETPSKASKTCIPYLSQLVLCKSHSHTRGVGSLNQKIPQKTTVKNWCILFLSAAAPHVSFQTSPGVYGWEETCKILKEETTWKFITLFLLKQES